MTLARARQGRDAPDPPVRGPRATASRLRRYRLWVVRLKRRTRIATAPDYWRSAFRAVHPRARAQLVASQWEWIPHRRCVRKPGAFRDGARCEYVTSIGAHVLAWNREGPRPASTLSDHAAFVVDLGGRRRGDRAAGEGERGGSRALGEAQPVASLEGSGRQRLDPRQLVDERRKARIEGGKLLEGAALAQWLRQLDVARVVLVLPRG